jgi:hypothetical protein
MLIEIAIVAALAPLIALFFECRDRRAIARRNALLARLSANPPATSPPRDEPLQDTARESDPNAAEPNA